MITLQQTLKSEEDASVNFIFGAPDIPGFFEARYVRRKPEYFVIYLSSQSGCRMACRFCHLTATKQIQSADADKNTYLAQAKEVMGYYKSLQQPAERVHFSFMSRGEALANSHLIKEQDYSILEALGQLALQENLFPSFTISTILPKSLPTHDLTKLFPLIYPDFYYSIYSMNPAFRKKWLPNALPAETGLEIFSNFQKKTKKILKLHWSFIEDENDSTESIILLSQALSKLKLRVDVNIVRYNPFSEAYGRESSEKVIEQNVLLLRKLLPEETAIKVIDRVGRDVYASCGMFNY